MLGFLSFFSRSSTQPDEEEYAMEPELKRPLMVGDSFVLTGFKEAEWEEKLLK